MRRRAKVSVGVVGALLALVAALGMLPGGAAAELSSQPSSVAAGGLDLGRFHSCAVLPTASLRCWGYGGDGALGYGDRLTIGDDETPAGAGPVDLGAGRTAKSVAGGSVFTCAVLDNNTVRCWGFGGDGRLGYGNTTAIGDNETPGSVGPVDIGTGRTATAITAGRAHTCVILDDRNVRCWGFGFDGRLGYGNNVPNDNNNIGDNETPGSVGPVPLGAGRTARAISVGDSHTCAILDDNNVRCWGYAANGQLGYGNGVNIGDDETPGSVGVVNLGQGRTAVALTAGDFHTCAVLDNGTVRCWGYGGNGRLGYASSESVGDNELPSTAGPVNLGAGRTAKAISAGGSHTCAILDDNSVRCWGYGASGQLGYANTDTIGDDEAPAAAGPVNLGPGRTAVAISAGGDQTCVRLDGGVGVRCWGKGINGELGYCDRVAIGDDETPAEAGPVDLGLGAAAGAPCPSPVVPPAPPPPPPPAEPPSTTPGTPEPTTPPDPAAAALAAEQARASELTTCKADVKSRARSERDQAKKRYSQRSAPRKRKLALLAVAKRAEQRRLACLQRFGRKPGQVRGLTAGAISAAKIVLKFKAPGSDGSHPPPARGYLVKQSLLPIRTQGQFERATALCKGTCMFDVTTLDAAITLTVEKLRPKTTYYYAVAARDNVSNRPGPRSETVSAKTR